MGLSGDNGGDKPTLQAIARKYLTHLTALDDVEMRIESATENGKAYAAMKQDERLKQEVENCRAAMKDEKTRRAILAELDALAKETGHRIVQSRTDRGLMVSLQAIPQEPAK
jgi:hypothetical protein